MKSEMQKSFEKLFNTTVSKRDKSLTMLHDQIQCGEYAKHCLSFTAGARSQEAKIKKLELTIKKLKGKP